MIYSGWKLYVFFCVIFLEIMTLSFLDETDARKLLKMDETIRTVCWNGQVWPLLEPDVAHSFPNVGHSNSEPMVILYIPYIYIWWYIWSSYPFLLIPSNLSVACLVRHCFDELCQYMSIQSCSGQRAPKSTADAPYTLLLSWCCVFFLSRKHVILSLSILSICQQIFHHVVCTTCMTSILSSTR